MRFRIAAAVCLAACGAGPDARAQTDAAARVVDPDFIVRPTLDTPPEAAAVQPDGKIIIGGTFLVLNENVPQVGLARLHADGSLDVSFKPPQFAAVRVIAVQPDGKILIGGNLNAPGGFGPPGIARLNSDGTRDASFASSLDRVPLQLLVTAAGKILVVGVDSTLKRLHANGAIDEAFVQTEIRFQFTSGTPTHWFERSITQNSAVGFQRAAFQPDGKIVTAGFAAFTDYQASSRVSAFTVQRLTSEGAVDPDFIPMVHMPTGSVAHHYDPRVLALRVLTDGQILVIYNERQKALRLSRSGDHVEPLSPAFAGMLRAAASDPSGKFWVSSSNAAGLQRFTASGSLDPRFRSDTVFSPHNSGPTLILPLDDGRALVAGPFTKIGDVSRTFFARLNADSLGGAVPPEIVGLSASALSVRAGEPLSVTIAATGTAPLSYSLIAPNGTTLATAATPDLTWENAQQSGQYRVVVRGAGNLTATRLIAITVTDSAPVIVTPPQSAEIEPGASVSLAVATRGTDPRSFQWFRNGEPIADATTSSLTLATVSANDVGDYTVVVRNPLGLVSSTARVDWRARLRNLSTRGLAGTGENTMICGFVIRGEHARDVVVRGIGPGLARFGVTQLAPDPKLSLFDAHGALVAENDDWQANNSGVNAEVFVRAGAFPLEPGSLDAAITRGLSPGSYTVHLSTGDRSAGIGLVEVYELGTATPRLVNVSSRVLVGRSAEIAIPGLVVSGSASATPRRLLVRAVGPGLARFGVQAPLADPVVTLVDGEGRTIATNDNWGNDLALAAAFTAAGAFPLAPSDAALLATVRPGSYTALIRSADGGTGVALAEIYELP